MSDLDTVKEKKKPEVIEGNYVDFAPDFLLRGYAYKPIPKQVISGPGDIAYELVKRWGLVAGTTDGDEDAAGRQKMRLMKPTEIVEHACETADLLWAELHKRN